jgi:hypothetical protein
MTGKTLAHYAITSRLGKGGMGGGVKPRRRLAKGSLKTR